MPGTLASGDEFGFGVHVQGDRAIAAANKDDVGGLIDAGSAYVFERAGDGSWLAVAHLTVSNPAAHDELGNGGVWIGDDRAVIGAARNSAAPGSLYVFEKPLGGWTDANETYELLASPSATSDRFGASVTVQGGTIVGCAPLDDEDAVNGGAVYVFAPPPAVVVPAAADAFLRGGNPNRNEGANPRLRLQASGNNRVVVAFEPGAFDMECLVAARLVLFIEENADNWGPAGDRTVDAHPLLVGFAEGNGMQAGVPAALSTRGIGEGVTWNCSQDAAIENQKADCGLLWGGGTFGPATAAPVLHTNGLDYLRPGEHTIAIRLTARSTTTYWLLEARLEFTPEPD